MSFIDKLQVTYEKEREYDIFLSEEEKKLYEKLFGGQRHGMRLIEWLNIDFENALSIQASSMHYCFPKALVDLKDYKEFELAFMYRGEISSGKKLIENFPRKEELENCNNGTSIYAYVPKDLIEDLYKFLKK